MTSALLLTAPAEDAGTLQGNFIEAARKSGLPYLVKYSAYGTSLDSPRGSSGSTPGAYRPALLQYGVPEWLADGVVELHQLRRDGGAAKVTGGVEEIAHKKPYTIAEFAKHYIPAFWAAKSAAKG